MALVFLVMFLFLQNWRYTIIPTIVVPIALLGTFATLLALGFSINVLTMFGMVLVIGIVVDDAIVVVENVERIMEEEKLPPRAATRKAMRGDRGNRVHIAQAGVAVFVLQLQHRAFEARHLGTRELPLRIGQPLDAGLHRGVGDLHGQSLGGISRA